MRRSHFRMIAFGTSVEWTALEEALQRDLGKKASPASLGSIISRRSGELRGVPRHRNFIPQQHSSVRSGPCVE